MKDNKIGGFTSQHVNGLTNCGMIISSNTSQPAKGVNCTTYKND